MTSLETDNATTVRSPTEFIDHETSGHDAKTDLRLWLRLLSCVNMIEARIRTRLHREFDVTLRRFDCMAALHRAGGPLAMGELSKRLMVSNGNATGLIDRLEQEGLVARTRSDSDRRAQFVALTDAGRDAFEAMADANEGWIAAAFSGLDDTEIASLMELLGKMKLSVHDNLPQPHD
mgnify:CR=1 FL=1